MKLPPPTMVALITPFDSDGSLDERAHLHNLETLTGRGVTGFLLGGSTGQSPYLEAGERASLTTIARRLLGSSAFLLTGVSAQSVRQAAAQVKEAAESGADAVLVTTPTLLLRGNAELVASFYRAVADISPIPVFCYTVPAVTGYELPVETAVDLARHPNIVGMKDSGGKAERITPVLTGAGPGYTLFTGASRLVHEAVALGAYGAITASTNYTPDLVISAGGDADAQRALTAMTAIVERFGLAGTYAASELAGLIPGTMRAPLVPLGESARAQISDACCSTPSE